VFSQLRFVVSTLVHLDCAPLHKLRGSVAASARSSTLQPSRTTRPTPLSKLNRLVVGSTATKGRSSDNVVGGGGLEIALMIPIFLGLGWVIDRVAGTAPVFMIIMVVLGAVGVFCRLRYAYDEKIREQEELRRARRSGQPSGKGQP